MKPTRSGTRRTLAAACLLSLGTSLTAPHTHAQAQDETDATTPEPPPAATPAQPPAGPGADPAPGDFDLTQPARDPNDVLGRLLDQRNQDAIQPEGAPRPDGPLAGPQGNAAAPAAPDLAVLGLAPHQLTDALYREGDFLVQQRGQLIRDPAANLTAFHFTEPSPQRTENPDQDTDTTPPADRLLICLPSRFLEVLENELDRADAPLDYELSGQVFVYRGVNYLMLTLAVPVSPAAPPNAPDPAPHAEPERSEGPDALPTNEPAPDDEDPNSAQSVLDQLLTNREPSPAPSPDANRLTPPPSTGPNENPNPANPADATDAPQDGDFLLNRRGRLTRAQGGYAVFTFDAAGGSNADPPVYVYPCRLLEQMENTVLQRGDSTVFEVSGQLHAYRGDLYLLPRISRLAIDRGNLG